MLMALFQNKESLSSNKTTRVCGQADKNVQLQARPRGLIGVRRDFNLLLHPIVIRRLTMECSLDMFYLLSLKDEYIFKQQNYYHMIHRIRCLWLCFVT